VTVTPATVLLMTALSMAPLSKEVPATYDRNHDGDTVTLTAELIPGVVFKDVSYRLENIDTPEINGQCAYEKRLAAEARKAVTDLLRPPNARIRLHLTGQIDPYGRPLAKVSVNEEDLGQKLIRANLARVWDGARHPWCPAPIPASKPSNDR
jgi:micrococcal nuclease